MILVYYIPRITPTSIEGTVWKKNNAIMDNLHTLDLQEKLRKFPHTILLLSAHHEFL